MKNKNRYIISFIISLAVIAALVQSKEKKIFPHKVHSDNGFECSSCHAKIESSTSARNNNIPGRRLCYKECHERDILKGIAFNRSKPAFTLAFNHETHISMDMKCLKCHRGINSADFKPGSAFPDMKLCFSCHNNETAAKTCTLCHRGKVPFPHKVHIDSGNDCETCHPNIKKSVSTTGAFDIPSKKICNDCHEADDKYTRVTRFYYDQAYKINHKLHVEEQGLDCKECHMSVYKKKVTHQHVPTLDYCMDYCFNCHDNETASQHCMLCHINHTVPDDHTADWENLHKVKASSNPEECKACHTSPSFCVRCHKGQIKTDRYHNPNFELTHRYESLATMKNCKSCHSERYCQKCHKDQGVSLRSRVTRKQHPIGWTNRLSPNFHKKKARLRLSTCTACHTKNDCSYCHFRKR